MATKYLEAGFALTLVTRSQPEPAKSSFVVTREDLNESKSFTLACEPANLLKPIQRLLVTTKSNQVQQALVDIGPRLNAETKIILLHNGMGTLKAAQEQFSPAQIYCGVTTEGAYLQTRPLRQLIYAGHGTTDIGQIGQTTPPAWIRSLLDSSLGFSWQRDIEVVQWRKLLINCAINPLTAIHGCRNGELLSIPALQAQLRLVVTELEAVAAALGYQSLASNLFDLVEQVATQTQANYSSMQQDVQHQRATEIAYINGYLCEQARLMQVATPMNNGLVAAIQHIEQTYNTRSYNT